MAFGWDDLIIAGIGAASSAYTANSAANSVQGSNQANEELFYAANQFTAQQAQWARDFNASEAALARDHSTKMANTAYQRAVEDMKAAGLNPMLTISQGGAGAPSVNQAGGSPSGSSTSPPTMRAAGKEGLAMAMSMASAVSSIRNQDADTALKRAAASKEIASAANLDKQTVRIEVELPKLQAEAALLRTQIETEHGKQQLMKVEQALKTTEEFLAAKKIDHTQAMIVHEKAKAVLAQLQKPEAEAYAKKFSSEWGGNVSPYMREFLDVVRAILYGRATGGLPR